MNPEDVDELISIKIDKRKSKNIRILDFLIETVAEQRSLGANRLIETLL